jgi:hypothetical protein
MLADGACNAPGEIGRAGEGGALALDSHRVMQTYNGSVTLGIANGIALRLITLALFVGIDHMEV